VDAVRQDESRAEGGTRREEHESESREEDVVTVAEMAAAKGYVRVLVPPALRSKVLKLVHGNKLGGHWRILRTAAMVCGRYCWPGWA
jgi:hypothetical protein